VYNIYIMYEMIYIKIYGEKEKERERESDFGLFRRQFEKPETLRQLPLSLWW